MRGAARNEGEIDVPELQSLHVPQFAGCPHITSILAAAEGSESVWPWLIPVLVTALMGGIAAYVRSEKAIANLDAKLSDLARTHERESAAVWETIGTIRDSNTDCDRERAKHEEKLGSHEGRLTRLEGFHAGSSPSSRRRQDT